jgi:hypothetical protein
MRLLTGSREGAVADAVIRDPDRHTSFDEHGAVHSVQAADLTMPEEQLDAIWSPMHLERLARTYWKYLSRVTLGLIRVTYTPTERYLVLLARRFVLLRFRAPEYEMDDRRGVVRWRIRDGILVASEGHEGGGYLEIDIRRRPAAAPGRATLHVEVEIASFYPAIAFRIARWVYANTQSRIHVLVTHGFLRSLANLELEKSVIGRFAPHDGGPREESVTVGDTPWPVVGGLLAVAAAALALIRRSSR